MPGEWTTIKVPRPLNEKIQELSIKQNMAAWKVVASAISHYEHILRKPREKANLEALDKAAWYAYKLAKSIGHFIENPCEKNEIQLCKTLEQVRSRLGVDVRLLARALKDYRDNPCNRTKQEVNDVAKMVIAEIMRKLLFAQ